MMGREPIGAPPPGAAEDVTGVDSVAGVVDETVGGGRGRRWLEEYLPAIILFVVGLGGWEMIVRLLDIQAFLLPAPTVIGTAFVENFDRLMHVGWFTTKEALGGFVIGCGLGIGVALATARWTAVSETLMPFAVAANSVPIIAFAPILNNWFGVDNPLSKMVIVAVIIFFPMMINTVRGLTLVDAAALELMRSYAASEWQILRHLRWPNALPYMFNAFKVAATLSMIGAVVSEYFGGNRSALGIFITQEAAQFRFANAWAGILVACVVGVTFYVVILLVERVALPWHVSVREK
ncbi:MAG TPA: ABC transporter permease [Anaerolineae bacterium]|nr:ABC transporter permease [Anaerolineae bacterium]